MITFGITSDGSSVTITGTTNGYVLPTGHKLILSFAGSINGSVANYELSEAQAVLFAAKTPFTISVSDLTDESYTVLPDDFYRLQITEKSEAGAVVEISDIAVLSSYFWIQKRLHDEIVSTQRILSFFQKQELHSKFIHLHVLEIYGQNPPLSKEDAIVSRINYLKTV